MVEHGSILAAVAPNVAIKVPATAAGLKAAEELVAAGINVNATVSFTVPQAVAVAEAFERGLDRAARPRRGHARAASLRHPHAGPARRPPAAGDGEGGHRGRSRPDHPRRRRGVQARARGLQGARLSRDPARRRLPPSPALVGADRARDRAEHPLRVVEAVRGLRHRGEADPRLPGRSRGGRDARAAGSRTSAAPTASARWPSRSSRASVPPSTPSTSSSAGTRTCWGWSGSGCCADLPPRVRAGRRSARWPARRLRRARVRARPGREAAALHRHRPGGRRLLRARRRAREGDQRPRPQRPGDRGADRGQRRQPQVPARGPGRPRSRPRPQPGRCVPRDGHVPRVRPRARARRWPCSTRSRCTSSPSPATASRAWPTCAAAWSRPRTRAAGPRSSRCA